LYYVENFLLKIRIAHYQNEEINKKCYDLSNIHAFIYKINEYHISNLVYIINYCNMENISQLHTWVDEYSISHKNPTNILIHEICVLVIVFIILGFF
jgi:hypothetical protein